jgi:hypothetical protein
MELWLDARWFSSVGKRVSQQVWKIAQEYNESREVGMRGITMASLGPLSMCFLTSCEDFSVSIADMGLSFRFEGLLKEGNWTKSFHILRKLLAKDRGNGEDELRNLWRFKLHWMSL